jgi:hypothetical protein
MSEAKQREVRVFGSAAEAEAADREYWRSLTPDERIELTWQMSEELWRLRGAFNDDPRLCRTVASVRRR